MKKRLLFIGILSLSILTTSPVILEASQILINKNGNIASTQMKYYKVNYKYSRNGSSWTGTSTSIKASSEVEAIEQIKSKHPYVKDIKIISVR